MRTSIQPSIVKLSLPAVRRSRAARHPSWRSLAAVLALLPALTTPTQASIFKGEALDTMADVLTWVVLIIAPAIGIALFWLVHILPEKIAEKREHPQAKAIQCLCLLSLVFGGLLWPLAWLWAYSKPVLYKLAYGTDRVPHEPKPSPRPTPAEEEAELGKLRLRVAELENRLANRSTSEGGMA